MADSPVSRRGFVGVIAGSAAVWLAASRSDLEAAAAFARAPRPTDAFQVLTAEEARVLDAATAQIVPTDELPGAREANVVRFIDRSLATWAKDEADGIRRQVQRLNELAGQYVPGAKSFTELTGEQQLGLLKSYEERDPARFGGLREVTMAGMFTDPSYGGNAAKVGWKMLGFEDRFTWAPPFGYYDRG